MTERLDRLTTAKEVWELLPLPPDTYRYVFAKLGSGHVGTWVEGPAMLARFMQNWSDADCHINLNPARRPDLVRPRAADITHLQAILLDIDPIDKGPVSFVQGGPAQPAAFACRLLERLTHRGIPSAKTTIIDSGRGIQLWLHFDPIPLVGTGSMKRCTKAFLEDLSSDIGEAFGCRLDTGCYDPTRLARLPGTTNQKTGKRARIMYYGKPISPTFLFKYDTGKPPAKPAPPGSKTISWTDLVPYLNPTAYSYIVDGVISPGRHAGCVAAAKCLQEANAAHSFAYDLLALGAERCTPALEDSEVHYIWRRHFPPEHVKIPLDEVPVSC